MGVLLRNVLGQRRLVRLLPWRRKILRPKFIQVIIILCITVYFGRVLIPSFHTHLDSVDQRISAICFEIIHVAVPVLSETKVMQVISMIKSAMYYHGRLRKDEDDCESLIASAPCYTPPKGPKGHLHFHIVVDSNTESILKNLLIHSGLGHLAVSFYDIGVHEKTVEDLSKDRRLSVVSLTKMLIPDIIPTTVHKVLLIDTGVLFNEDICQLWAYFQQFSTEQAVGAVLEQTWWNYVDAFSCFGPEQDHDWDVYTNLSDCRFLRDHKVPRAGINDGVMLLHLDRMRKINWNLLWRKEYRKQMKRNGKLLLGEKGLFDGILWDSPHLYYKLPCTWNVQVTTPDAAKFCPVLWLDRITEAQLCSMRDKEMCVDYPAYPNVVYMILPPQVAPEPAAIVSHQFWLRYYELAWQFPRIFSWFSNLPIHCLDQPEKTAEVDYRP